MRIARLRADARAAWEAGIHAADPALCVTRALDARPDLIDANTLIVAAGKAATGMMRGAIRHAAQRGRLPGRAIVLLPEAAGAGDLPAPAIVLRAGHPYPTEEGVQATLRILSEVDSLGRGQRLLFLLSGGASALLEAPVAGIGAGELASVHRALVGSGLAIGPINRVRGCLSAVKAGRLAERAWPAAVTTLAISDVEGDDPAAIGSGPTVPPAGSRAADRRAAIEILRQAAIDLPPAVAQVLEAPAAPVGPVRDNPTQPPAAPDYTVIASSTVAEAGARAELEARGYEVAPGARRTRYLRGPTREAAEFIVRETGTLASVDRAARAAVFAGETTVAITAPDPGRGGRNLDLAARLALALEGNGRFAAAVGGSDGCDGSSRAAGAVIDGATAARARDAHRPLEDALAAFDTEPAIESAGDLLVTGPTGTNVGDLIVFVTR